MNWVGVFLVLVALPAALQINKENMALVFEYIALSFLFVSSQEVWRDGLSVRRKRRRSCTVSMH